MYSRVTGAHSEASRAFKLLRESAFNVPTTEEEWPLERGDGCALTFG